MFIIKKPHFLFVFGNMATGYLARQDPIVFRPQITLSLAFSYLFDLK